MTEPQKAYHGHLTLSDGTHQPLTAEQAESLWRGVERHQKEVAARLPDEATCLKVMCEAYHRLRDFGWNDATYCPKDGSVFEVIEAGSTGVFDCHYEGYWPDGRWWLHEAGELWPSRPILFRKKSPSIKGQ